jgi:AAHS family 4-hydroxybenzoate transporter-like MFS transporter
MAESKVSIAEVLDANRFTPYQAWICFLCFCVVLMDGFDLTAIGVTLPKIADFLQSKPDALGLAVGAGQLGPLLGAIVFGMLADRWGRKRTAAVSAVLFGLFTLLTAFITSVEQLALCRFLAGLGLGGAIPIALAYGCEYAPSRLRASLTTTMYAGMAFGSMGAGLLAAYMLPRFGWQSLYYVGGAVPVVVGFLVALFLPESLAFLVRRGKDEAQVRKIISRIAPSVARDDEVAFCSSEEKLPGVPVKHLFTQGRAFNTVLLWLLFFLSFYLIWILLSWAPTLLRQSGATVRQYSLAFACINLGSAIATITIGRLMDRFDPFRMLKVAFVLAFVSLVFFGVAANSPFIVIAAVSTVTGFFVFGGNSGIMALATISYPPEIRGTGIGWAYAVGKVGSMLAPVVGGMLLSRNWSVSQICGANAVAALLVAGAIVILQRHVSSAGAQDAG